MLLRADPDLVLSRQEEETLAALEVYPDLVQSFEDQNAIALFKTMSRIRERDRRRLIQAVSAYGACAQWALQEKKHQELYRHE